MTEFKGYAWTELVEAFGIIASIPEWQKAIADIEEGTDDPMGNCDFHDHHKDWVVLHNTRRFLAESLGGDRTKEVADTLRSFLTALYEQSAKIDYFHPLWKGLGEIEDDETLIKVTCYVLPLMWT